MAGVVESWLYQKKNISFDYNTQFKVTASYGEVSSCTVYAEVSRSGVS